MDKLVELFCDVDDFCRVFIPLCSSIPGSWASSPQFCSYFDGIAKRGKGSIGWFFGFKLPLIVNHQGEIVSVKLTPGNVDDREPVRELGD